MASYNPDGVTVAGVAPTYHAAASSDILTQNDGKCIVHVKNGSGGSINVTFDDIGSQSPVGASAFTPDVVDAVGATSDRFFGPFPTSRFGTSLGIAFSATATVTWAAIKMPPAS